MKSDFAYACHDIAQLPPSQLPEVAIAGRSNCGKSSLINAVLGHRIARTSQTPGRTRELVFFSVTLPGAPPFLLVDLPGYGYAQVSRKTQQHWGELVTGYLCTRPLLTGFMLLADVRRGLAQEEHDALGLLAQRKLAHLIVLTKADKVNKTACFTAQRTARHAAPGAQSYLTASVNDAASIGRVRDALIRVVAGVSAPAEAACP